MGRRGERRSSAGGWQDTRGRHSGGEVEDPCHTREDGESRALGIFAEGRSGMTRWIVK